jgi:ABC-2 type transport system permease protein
VTAALAARPAPSTFWQWWVLSLRLIKPTLRNGEVFIAIAASVVFTAGLYIPLNHLMGSGRTGMSSYAQYVMPLIALQAVCFAAISAALRAATDAVEGINRRFGSMPIASLTPLTARMSANMYRCAIGLAGAIVCGHVIGFRFYGTPWYTAGFVLLALLIGASLSFLFDVIGTRSKSPEATTQLLTVPQMILGLLSIGVQPADRFPEWIQPFVRNQPISQFVGALRALAGDSTPAAGSVTWQVIGPSLAWVAGFVIVALPLSIMAARRRH